MDFLILRHLKPISHQRRSFVSPHKKRLFGRLEIHVTEKLSLFRTCESFILFLYWIGKSANKVCIFQMITPVTDFTHKMNDRKEDIIGFKWLEKYFFAVYSSISICN